MLRIERIEVFVTDLPGRLRRRMSSGGYDTGAGGNWIGKPVLVKLHAGGLVGLGQIRPISPGHWMPDTVYSMLHAITDYFGPRLIGMDAFDMAGIERIFDVNLAIQPKCASCHRSCSARPPWKSNRPTSVQPSGRITATGSAS